ncbi:MAG: translation initiation factor IF-2 [Myxococcota bacterium]
MTKIRVYDLAKKLKAANSDLVRRLNSAGLRVKSHSSSVDEEAAYKALGIAAPARQESSQRPRTLLRRRRPAPAEAPSATAAESPQAQPASAQASTQEAPTEQNAPATPQQKEPKEPDEETAQTGTAATRQQTGPAPTKPQAPKEARPSGASVVGTIDAGAIRARLAKEGKGFSGSATPTKSPQPASSPFGRVREVTIGAPSPSNWRPGGTNLGGAGGGPHRHDHRRGSDIGGGRELWAARPKKKKTSKKNTPPPPSQTAAHKRVVELSGPIVVSELAHRMSLKAGQVVAKLFQMGTMVTVNQSIDQETAAIIAAEFGFEAKNVGFDEASLLEQHQQEDKTQQQPRPPVVTVMGHVDHGKTSLLDALRDGNVAALEHGGITQHIGAYSAATSHGSVTFLDTPGHEAFTAMRARGAQITDIVVLVVAADDGVMPQTKEAIDHAKAAKVPLIVAVNKMDAPGAKPEQVLQQLAEHEVVCEEWGGDVQVFRVSALKKQGLDKLLEGISVQAELAGLQANPTCRASGIVIEARLDRGQGPIATLLPREGTLKQGDAVVLGRHSGRVRRMMDSCGKQVKEAPPCFPVQVLGLSGVPMAGDSFHCTADDKAAKLVAAHRAQKQREQELLQSARGSADELLQQQAQQQQVKTLRLVVKTDVFGSMEAITAAVKNLSSDDVKVEVVHHGVGAITESDVHLAIASQAHVIGFHTKPDAKALRRAVQAKLTLHSCAVIYDVIDHVRELIQQLLGPVFEEVVVGTAGVRQVFPVSKLGKIAGCRVLTGNMVRSASVRVKRADEVVHTGRIASLKRFKDDAKQVEAGYECGLCIEGFGDVQEGDVLECLERKKVDRPLNYE